jgi:uncharacterized pyridoxal phosphate-containing UPF0001 family protein
MIQKNIASILAKIKLAKEVSHVKHDVRLVAVSKTKSCEEIMQAYNCGIRHFGENYVEEI